MPADRRLLRALAACGCALAITLAAGCGPGDPGPAARVGDQSVSRELLEAATVQAAQAAPKEIPAGSEAMDRLREQTLRQLVLNEELYLEARGRGLAPSDEEVDRYLFARSGSDPLAAAPDALTRLQARDQLTLQQLRADVGKNVAEPTEAEIRKAYTDNPSLFAVPRTRQVIYLRALERAPLDEISAANADLHGIFNAGGLPDGVTGGQVSWSENPSDPSLNRAVFSAPLNRKVGPAHYASGWVLFQATAAPVEGSRPGLAKARAQVEQLVRERALADAWQPFVDKVAFKYQPQVEIADDLKPAEGASAPATPAPGTTTTP